MLLAESVFRYKYTASQVCKEVSAQLEMSFQLHSPASVHRASAQHARSRFQEYKSTGSSATASLASLRLARATVVRGFVMWTTDGVRGWWMTRASGLPQRDVLLVDLRAGAGGAVIRKRQHSRGFFFM